MHRFMVRRKEEMVMNKKWFARILAVVLAMGMLLTGIVLAEECVEHEFDGDGTCANCGYACTHGDVNAEGICNICSMEVGGDNEGGEGEGGEAEGCSGEGASEDEDRPPYLFHHIGRFPRR